MHEWQCLNFFYWFSSMFLFSWFVNTFQFHLYSCMDNTHRELNNVDRSAGGFDLGETNFCRKVLRVLLAAGIWLYLSSLSL